MPKNFPERDYFRTVNDLSIPAEMGSIENIVLTVKGLREMAQYYKEKYAIEIVPFSASMQTAPQALIYLMNEKKQKIAQEFYRCGFIFIDSRAGAHGHGMPIIWEKNGDKDNLFLLDSGQFLGRAFDERPCDLIASALFTEQTDLAALPGNALAAYVISDQDVYFVDREKGYVTNLSTTLSLFGEDYGRDDRMYFSIRKIQEQLNLPEGKCIQIPDETLITIRSITDHDVNYDKREPKKFRDELLQLNPNIVMWSHVGARQIDHSSCMTDAMVIVKDGLRLKNTLEAHAREKFIKNEQNINFFYMPESLLKSAQISSFAGETSKANPDKEIHIHHKKDSQGNSTKDTMSVTLREFRERYEVPAQVAQKIKKFGFYALHKGKRFSKIIEKRWRENQKQEMETLLAALARTFEDSGNYNNEEELIKNIYIYSLHKGSNDEARQMLIKILDYVSMVLEDPAHFSMEMIKQADSAKKLLIALSLEKNFSNLYEHLKNLAEKFQSTSLINPERLLIILACELCDEIKSHEEPLALS